MHFAPCTPRSFCCCISRDCFLLKQISSLASEENGIYEILERHELIVVYLADRFRREFLRLISRRRRSFHRAHTIKIGNFISLTRGEIFACGEQRYCWKTDAYEIAQYENERPIATYFLYLCAHRKSLFNFTVATNKLISVRSICLPTILASPTQIELEKTVQSHSSDVNFLLDTQK